MGVITGDTFNPIKAFCSVRLQQGVPLVDADMNELDDIRKFEVRAYLKWFVGDGIPDGSDGFRVDAIAAPGVADDFIIRAGVPAAAPGETNVDTGLYNTGRCLVDGLDVIIPSDINYKAQPLYSAPGPDGSRQVQPIPPNSNGTLLVYLDVWERLVTVQEDPALVLPALGTESCVRLKRDWVVRTLVGDAGALPSNGGGHSYYPLATIAMSAPAVIVQSSIKDLRRKGLTLTSIEDRVRNLETRLLVPGFAASGTQISPLAAHVGDSIVLNGRNFDVGGLAPSDAPTVVIGGMTATVTAFTYSTVTVTVPSLAAGAAYSVSITTAGGGPVQADDHLTVQPPKGKEGKEKEAKDKEGHKEVVKDTDVPPGKLAEGVKVQIEAQFSGSIDASVFGLSFADEPHAALDGAGRGRAFIRPEERPPVGRGSSRSPTRTREKMLLVLAHPCDEGARFLAERWQARGARLMVPRDLSAPGWRHHVGGGGEEWAIASGERVRVAGVTGVLVRLPGIRDEFLPHIAAVDRTYVAAEMNAFLIAWLTALACPVLNRPGVGSILGPSLSHERWLAAAARAGLRLAFPRHQAPCIERPHPAVQVTVVGERWFGEVDPALGDEAVRLAQSVGADLLTAHFYGSEEDAAFAGIDLLVDPTRAGVADALLARFDGTCG